MRVLLITRRFPPSIGGMQTFAHDYYQALSAKTEVRLVKWGGSNWALPVVLPYLLAHSAWMLMRGGVDIIHAQDTITGFLAYILARLWRKPYVVVVHGLDITYRNPLFNWFVPRAVRHADKVICISQSAADAAMDRGVDAARIEVIPLAVQDRFHGRANRGVLLGRLGLSQDTQTLLTVGRLVPRKGVAWFIGNVLPDLIKNYPKLVYVVVGEGEDRAPIEAVVREHGLEERVHLLGFADDKLYEAAYNGADVFVMPNIKVEGDMEGFGLVLLEAALCARPVVAAGIEGILDAVADGQNGVLVPSGDAKAFAKATSSFLDDSAKAAAFGQHARDYTLENFQWPSLVRRYIEVYESLL